MQLPRICVQAASNFGFSSWQRFDFGLRPPLSAGSYAG
jgi:hypothetical protein